jgi:hypothetical protein
MGQAELDRAVEVVPLAVDGGEISLQALAPVVEGIVDAGDKACAAGARRRLTLVVVPADNFGPYKVSVRRCTPYRLSSSVPRTSMSERARSSAAPARRRPGRDR